MRADYAYFRYAERGQCVDVGARHARVQNVADNRDTQLREVFFVVADGVHVEQALCRVRMATVAGIDDADVFAPDFIQMLGHEVGCAALVVAHDEHVGVHCREVVHGVNQGFAFAGGGGFNVQVDHVGGQALGRDFKGGARACGVFEENIEY